MTGSSPEGTQIVFLINSLAVGGAERVFVEQANALQARGWDVHFACLFSYGSLRSKLQLPEGNIHVIGATSIFDIRAVFRIARLVRERRIRKLYTTLNEANTVGRFVKCVAPHLRLYTREANMADIKPALYKFVDITLGWTSAVIIPVSGAVEDSLCRYAPWLRSRMRVLGNGVRIPAAMPIRAEHAETRLLSVGSFTPKKGHALLIEAMKLLPERFVLTLVGDGALRSTLEEFVRDLGLSARVTFVGAMPHERVDEYYTYADIFVLPSEREGSPNVVLEAQSFALPVVAFNIPGIGECVNDSCGKLVSERTALSLAAAIREIADQPDTARTMGERAYRLVSKTRGYEQHYEKLVRILNA